MWYMSFCYSHFQMLNTNSPTTVWRATVKSIAAERSRSVFYRDESHDRPSKPKRLVLNIYTITSE